MTPTNCLALNVASFFIDPFVIVFLSDLLYYHLWLYLKNMSTYEHVLKKRNEKDVRVL